MLSANALFRITMPTETSGVTTFTYPLQCWRRKTEIGLWMMSSHLPATTPFT